MRARRERIVLVKDGGAAATIVVADRSPAPPVRFAADELQKYLRLMTGAELPLRRRAGSGPAVVLSTAAHADLSGEDAHRLTSEGRRLFLTGASPRAVLYAAYRLLEHLGCGFCVPGEETVPRRRTVAVPPLDETHVPAFETRAHVDFPFHASTPVAWPLAVIDWLGKNRFNWYHPAPNAYGESTVWRERRGAVLEAVRARGLHLQLGGHTIHTWLPPDRYFKAHPEWYALVEGKGGRRARRAPMACVSHPAVHRTVLRNIGRFLDRCPEVETIDLWDADVEQFCRCPRCLRHASRGGKDQPDELLRTAYTVSYIEFINAVARGLRRRHPRVRLSAMIYAPRGVVAPLWCPNVEDNVIVSTAHILRDSYVPLAGTPRSERNLRLLTMDLSWRQKARHVSIYEYYNAWTNSGIYPQVNVIGEDLRLLRGLGFPRIETDQGGWSALNMYAAARLMWNPDLAWEEVVGDFCLRHYGEAAAAMLSYWLELERGLRGRGGYIADLGGSKQWLQRRRRSAIRQLSGIVESVSDPIIRERLEREIVPWRRFGERQHLRSSLPEPFTHHWPA